MDSNKTNAECRVLHIIPVAPTGRSFTFAKKQADVLEKKGVIIGRFLLKSRTSPIVLFHELIRLKKEIKVFKPNLIHANYGTVTALFSIFATRLPLIITFRGSDLNPNPGVDRLKSSLATFFSQISALFAKEIICVSERLKKRLWWKQSKVTVIPSGIDLEFFRPYPYLQARSEIGWSENELVVIFNKGRNQLGKRLDLAQAGVEVAERICGEILFVVLNGFIERELMPKMLNGADCLLMASDWEGSPNVVKEALACNLPVVSVDAGDVRERLQGVTSSAVVNRDPNEIGKALAEILKRKKRSNGFNKIKDITLEKCALRIINIYKRCIIN